MRAIILVSVVIGLLAGGLAPFIGGLHVYRATSGYSGKQFWFSFRSVPQEEDFLDAVIYREPLITGKYETTQEWRKSQESGSRYYIKAEEDSCILIAPYDGTQNPDVVFKKGGRFKGVWLTEPATRTSLPVTLVGLAYGIGAFLVFSMASLCGLSLIRWFWYFLLRRISELASAVKNSPF